MKIIKLNEREIQINGNLFKISAPAEIESYLEIDNYLYVMINFPNGHSEQNENIWKIDSHGNTIWKIKKFGSDILGARPYVKMEFCNGRLRVDNWKGVNFYVNLLSGEIEPIGGGRPW